MVKKFRSNQVGRGRASAQAMERKFKPLTKTRPFNRSILTAVSNIEKIDKMITPVVHQQSIWQEAEKMAKKVYKGKDKNEMTRKTKNIYENLMRRKANRANSVDYRKPLSWQEKKNLNLLGTQNFRGLVMLSAARIKKGAQAVALRSNACAEAHSLTQQEYQKKDKGTRFRIWKKTTGRYASTRTWTLS